MPKCHGMSLQASTGKRVSPNLTLGGEAISEFDGSFKCLGMSVRLHINNSTAQTTLVHVDDLKRMLEAVDKAPATCQQKLRLYKQGICPRVSWPLLVEEFPVTWLERHLQPLATMFLKRWAGLARCSNTAILFLPGKRGPGKRGFALPSLVSLYKQQKLSHMAQLFSSTDPGVCQAAHLLLTEERKKSRVKFKPAVLVDEIRAQDPSRKRQALAGAAKSLLAEEDVEGRHEHPYWLRRMLRVDMSTCAVSTPRDRWLGAGKGISQNFG